MDHLARIDFTGRMFSTTLRTASVATAIGAATTGGVYFAFSSFVMTGLRRLPHRDGIVAMQAINRAAPSPLFMLAMFGTAAASVAVGIAALRRHDGAASTMLATGCGLYVASVVTTMAFHIPRNEALATLDPSGATASAAWHRFAGEWTAGNHVRTVLALGGAAAMIASLQAG